MLHEALPQTMTPEQLADWIRTNKVDVKSHVEKIPLTPDEIIDLEKKSSLASRAIMMLQDVKKTFDRYLKKGTPYNNVEENHEPISITIPPTKGLEALEANREHAERQLVQGYKELVTDIFLIPWPEYSKIVAFDIEGNEWSTYSRKMSKDEVKQHGRPILEATRKQIPLSDDELEELDL